MPHNLPDDYTLPGEAEDLLDECDTSYFQSSGPGGQHKNRSRTAVRLLHRPSGIVVIGRRQRSQRQNLRDALERLHRRLEALLRPAVERRPTKPGKAAKKRRMDAKRRRSDVKKLRRRVATDD